MMIYDNTSIHYNSIIVFTYDNIVDKAKDVVLVQFTQIEAAKLKIKAYSQTDYTQNY